MDKRLEEKMKEKLNETFDNKEELLDLVKSLKQLSEDERSFGFGLLVGRLYNSFYYQSRRILKRDPTKEEFYEFLDILKNHESEFYKEFDFTK